MKTKFVYTLVSMPNDSYLEQAMLSVHSLRQYNPGAIIALVVDDSTFATLTNGRERIKSLVTEVLPFTPPEGFNNMQRSRYLKTNLRNLIEGDYLFIDCDTIICDSLQDADSITSDLAMVSDLNGDLPLKDHIVLERCEKAGFTDMEGKPYFNSGVIYAKDTPVVHQFYKDWYKKWQQSSENGIRYDQPALCATNVEHGSMIQVLPGIWNCQYKMQGYQLLKNAKIMHYYSNNGNKDSFTNYLMDLFFQNIREYGVEGNPIVDQLLANPKKDFYAISTITKSQFMGYASSHSLYWYTNRPKLFEIIDKVGRFIEKLIY